MVSATIDYFDGRLLGSATREWQKMAKIVGTILQEYAEEGLDQTGDTWLSSRLIDLAEDGALEWRGEQFWITKGDVRLPEAPRSGSPN